MSKIKSNAGRKREPNPKISVVLMVRKSKIVGKDNLDMDIKSPEFYQHLEKLKEMLYETIDFTNE